MIKPVTLIWLNLVANDIIVTQMLMNAVKAHLCVIPMPSAPTQLDPISAHATLVTLVMATYVLVGHLTT